MTCRFGCLAATSFQLQKRQLHVWQTRTTVITSLPFSLANKVSKTGTQQTKHRTTVFPIMGLCGHVWLTWRLRLFREGAPCCAEWHHHGRAGSAMSLLFRRHLKPKKQATKRRNSTNAGFMACMVSNIQAGRTCRFQSHAA